MTPTDASAPDVALAEAFVLGDDAALRAAYDAHGAAVYSFCLRALGEHRAADVTQEVFVSAWRGRQGFDPSRGSLVAWLMGIARNRVIDDVRAEQRHASRRADLATDLPAETRSTEDSLDRLGDRLVVADALRRLPERARTAIELAYFADLTHAQIAERTNTPLGTVKSDIRRGLAQIRCELEARDV